MPKAPPSFVSPLAKRAKEIAKENAKVARKAADKKRPNSKARGYNHRWSKYRKVFLTENPLCVECQKNDFVTPAEVVDHIVPHNGDKEKFWDKENHQALCAPCHSRKTCKVDGGFGRPKREGASNPYTNPDRYL